MIRYRLSERRFFIMCECQAKKNEKKIKVKIHDILSGTTSNNDHWNRWDMYTHTNQPGSPIFFKLFHRHDDSVMCLACFPDYIFHMSPCFQQRFRAIQSFLIRFFFRPILAVSKDVNEKKRRKFNFGNVDAKSNCFGTLSIFLC